ncbi:GNAT family N-acetyltransferase [Gordonia zhaorongruii]|uniref:GNAT family N-acetyltransferase n=1 Tax=Gordonia zhaorongruii TaxID=2597659 RepID=UPI00104C57F8|nr:GNAT family N-acetyltransferase [Gordonia zhaorongruii]
MGSAFAYRPATQELFDDVEEMLGPKKRPDAAACWCLTYRLGNVESQKLDPPGRRAAVFELCGARPEPGILVYDSSADGVIGDVVGWAGVARRSLIAALADEQAFPRMADGDPWTIFCLRTRGGRRRQGIGQQILSSAVDFARESGAGVIEAYPVDPEAHIAPIYAYPGFRSMFERAGFTVRDRAGRVPGGPPRVAMSLDTQSVTTVTSTGEVISTR